MMIFHRFFAPAVAILLCSALFCGNDSFAEVVHAYRKPDEADIRWLLGNNLSPAPDLPDIVQVGFASPPGNILVPRSDPCRPVKVPIPMPSVPPPPQTASHRMDTGLVPEVDGVVSIAPIVIDSATSIIQMAGDRLPPPSEVPREASFAIPPVDLVAEPLAKPNNEGRFGDVPDHSPPKFGAKKCNHHENDQRFSVPDMLGGSDWLTGYSVGTTDGTTQFTLPTMLLSRPNVMERFNADVQNRIWADYRHWNNAVSISGNGTFESRAVEQFSFGLETRILRRSSLELRAPVISQFASKQTADSFASSVELGNVSVSVKQVLYQGARWTISGGGGATLPTAEDYRSPIADARLKNNAYYLVQFLGVQWHPNNDTFGHVVVQADLPIKKNELVFGEDRRKVDGQQVIRTGVQLGHWIYRADQHVEHPFRLGAFAEVHYAVVTVGSSRQELGNTYIGAFDSRKSTLTAAVGMPMVLGKLTCANSLILPISGSDYPFSVGYGFSLTRQF